MKTKKQLTTFSVFLAVLFGGCVSPSGATSETQITAHPAAVTNNPIATFEFTSKDENSFTCQLDDMAPAPCTSPYTATIANDGTHTFQVAATEKQANDETPAAFSWVLDRTAPTVTITSAPPALTGSTSATFDFTASKPDVTFTCSLDGAASASCVSGITFTELGNGQHQFSVFAADAAGNQAPSPATAVWQINSSTPNPVTVVTPGSSPYASSDTSITISGTCDDASTVTLTDGSASQSTSTTCALSKYSFTVTKYVDGVYPFSLAASSNLGDASAATAWQWTRDLSLPTTPTVSWPPVSFYYSSSDALTISGSCTPGLAVTLSGASTASTACSSGGSYAFAVNATNGENVYTYAVQQSNAGGATSGAATVRWTYDVTAPAAPTVTVPSSNPYTSADDVLTIQGVCESDATVTMTDSADNQITVPCVASNYALSIGENTDGTYAFELYQTDLAGNTSALTPFTWIRSTVSAKEKQP